MLVDQQAGRLARSDKALMCGTIKRLTTDSILEAYFRETSHLLLVLLLAVKLSGAVFLGLDCLSLNAVWRWCEKANVWGEYSAYKHAGNAS